jgi:hypothetical protein
MKNQEYLNATWDSLYAVAIGNKPLAIIESLKDVDAYEIAVMYAEANHLAYRCVTLTGEDGITVGEAVLVGRNLVAVGQALALIRGRRLQPDLYDREFVAVRLGFLLGYDADSIRKFINSAEFENCECDCCGGPSPAAEQRRIRRSMYHA